MAPYARVDNAGMYLRERTRKKNGKIHRYWSVVESRRLPSGKTVQKHVLYLGELNDVQHAGWVKSIEALAEDGAASGFRQMALFPDDRETFPDLEVPIVRIRINEMTMHRPRQYGACWLAMHLWQRLDLDAFWRPRLRSCREGTRWLSVLKTLVAYRRIAPGSEWRLHRHWFDNSAMMDLLMRLGAAKKEAGRAWSLVTVNVPEKNQEVNEDTFAFSLNPDKLRQARRREGRYLLRSNMTCAHPERVWEQYLLLTQVEQAFKDLKGDLAIRPIYQRKEPRIEAHIFVAFIAYCLQITLRNIGRQHGVGLTARIMLETFETVQMIDVQLPTTDDRCIELSRHTEPDDELKLLMERLRLELPAQPPPKITSAKTL